MPGTKFTRALMILRSRGRQATTIGLCLVTISLGRLVHRCPSVISSASSELWSRRAIRSLPTPELYCFCVFEAERGHAIFCRCRPAEQCVLSDQSPGHDFALHGSVLFLIDQIFFSKMGSAFIGMKASRNTTCQNS